MKPKLFTQKVIKICKGWYNKSKYNQIQDALKTLIAEQTYMEEKYIFTSHIMHKLMLVFEELNIEKEYKSIIEKLCEENIWGKKIITPEGIIDEMISVICLLNVMKDDNDEWIYDLSDLEGIKEIV